MESSSSSSKTKSKQNKFLDILKGTKKSNDPAYTTCTVKDLKGTAVDKVGKYNVDAIYLPICGDIINSKTLNDVIVIVTGRRNVNILQNKRFLSCNMKEDIKDFFIILTPKVYVLLQYEKNVIVYRFDEALMSLEEINKFNITVCDIIMTNDGQNMICCVADNMDLVIYSMPIGLFAFDNVVATYRMLLDAKTRNILYCINKKTYFLHMRTMRNIKDEKDVICADELFQVMDNVLVVQTSHQKTIITLMRNGVNEACYEFNYDLNVKVFGNIVSLYNSSKIFFYKLCSNKLKLISEINHATKKYSIKDVDILNSDTTVRIVFTVKGTIQTKTQILMDESIGFQRAKSEDNFTENTSNSPLNNLIGETSSMSDMSHYNASMDNFLNNINKSTPEKKEINMNGNNDSSTNEYIRSDKSRFACNNFGDSSLSNILSNMNSKIELICRKMEEERIRNEEENKVKFKKVLDCVSKNLNENLVSTIESAIKNEIRLNNQQSKKFINDCLNSVEKRNENVIKKLTEKVELFTIRGKKHNHQMEDFKQGILDSIVPVIKNSFETLKKQIIAEIKSTNSANKLSDKTILIQDEIKTLIFSGQTGDAAILALENDNNFTYFVENINGIYLDDLGFDLLNDLLFKAISIFLHDDNVSKLLSTFIGSVLMSLETSDMSNTQLKTFYDLLIKIDEIDWKDDTSLKFILMMKKKNALKLLKRIELNS